MECAVERNETKARILVVDDTPANLRLLKEMLEARGYVVHPASGGKAALRFLQANVPDLVLLNILMPEMSGYEVCEKIREDERVRDVPVIFISAMDQVLDKVRAFASGGVDYISKPFQQEEVLARVETHLGLHSLKKDLEKRVRERTAELVRNNEKLNAEIRERMLAERALRDREARIRCLVESNIIGVFFWDLEKGITDANNAFLSVLGYDRHDLQTGRIDLKKATPAPHLGRDERALAELHSLSHFAPYEKEFVRKDGSLVPVVIGGTFLEGSHREGVSFVHDLTEQKRAEERIRYMANYDGLTELPNRTLLMDRIAQYIALSIRDRNIQVGVLFLDLDFFKRINESLGYQTGDLLLQMAAERLRHCLRFGECIARLSGDEFVLVLPSLRESKDAAVVAQKVLDALAPPFVVGGQELHLSGSIGISLFPTDGSDPESLVSAADIAMCHAKEKGRSTYRFFMSDLNTAAQHRLVLEGKLHQALANKEFVLHYQPQVNLQSGGMYGAEALLRWQPNGEPPVACPELISIAEENGLILPLGEWVLRQACTHLKGWRESTGANDFRIGVNLSARQFYHPDLRQVVADILDDAGLPGNALDLELTETILMQPSEDNLALLRALSDMGIQLSLDDFGTGYSSLAYLQRFPIDMLKIDRSFVHGIGEVSNDTSLVTAIIAMAKSMHLKVLAEGVETATQEGFLKEHGCTAAQGFLYSRAVEAERIGQMLRGDAREHWVH